MATNSGIPRIRLGNSAGMSKHLRTFLREVELTDPAVSESSGFLIAKAAADGLFPPMSHAELADFNSQRAAEMARAEQRRNRQPQLELGHV